jgi:hypothetical protein
MRERDIENAVCEYARETYDAIPYKFTSPARRNVPDRLIVFPNGQLIFIEFKAPGAAPSSGQIREISRLTLRGQHVMIVDSVRQGRDFIDRFGNAPAR